MNTKRFITRPRLPDFDYVGARAYHVVIATREREPILVNRVASRVVGVLAATADSTAFELLAFTVMPDHVHILAVGTSDHSSLRRFTQRFKQVTSYEWIRTHGKRMWQPSFYDRTLRRDEDARAVARYILENPVRAQLMRPDERWPFSGGTMVAEADGGAKSTQLRCVASHAATEPVQP